MVLEFSGWQGRRLSPDRVRRCSGAAADDRTRQNPISFSLQKASVPAAFIGAREWQLEATLVGSRFTALLNGRELLMKNDLLRREPGKTQFMPGAANEISMKDIAIKLLDDDANKR